MSRNTRMRARITFSGPSRDNQSWILGSDI
jgi:hypothetical protein